LNNKFYLGKYFGVGPIGLFIEVLIWFIVYQIETVFKIPSIPLSSFLSWALIAVFAIDALYLIIGSNYYLFKFDHDERVIDEGPFQFIRHPIYGAAIYSFTGIIAVVAKSWGLFISVLPITMFWSWLVTYEENVMIQKHGKKYQDYIDRTGQFLPSWKAMKESAEEKQL
jgi:protein-S-isoprenylcysteine O-methyltransferase Ste14